MKRLRLAILLFCLLYLQVPVVGALSIDTLQVNYIGQEEGIKQLNVQRIVQDELDYLWFSTEDGLHRFNGLQLKVFSSNPLDSLSIPDDHNRGLLIVDDTLWIASNSKGVFALDLKTEQFSVPFPELSDKISYQVYELGSSHLLFSLSDKFYVLDRQTRGLEEIRLPRLESENYVKDVLDLGEGKFLLATLSSGLLTFDLPNYRVIDQKILGQFSHNALGRYQDELIIGTDKGLYTVHLESGEIKRRIDEELINCVFDQGEGRWLLGTKNGLISYHANNHNYTSRIFKDQSERVYHPIEIECIYGDQKGNLWFGTAGEGLHHFNQYQKKFETLELSVDGYTKDTKLSTFQILTDSDSTLWLGTSFNVLKFDRTTGYFKHYSDFPEALIYALAKDFNGDIYCGGFDGTGLLKYNPGKDKFEKVQFANADNDKTVIQIQPLSEQRLMLSTWSSGVYFYDLQTDSIQNFLISGRQLNRARISFVDSKNSLWLGSDQGAYMIENLGNGRVYHFQESSPDSIQISSNRIFAINEDTRGNIWLGTSTGLTQIDLNNWHSRRFYSQEGFPNDFVYGVLIDKKGSIWASTNQGISVLNPDTFQFMSYSEKDGLQNDEFNGKAAFQDGNGIFYFGGVDGINIFDPLNVITNPYQPKVHLESIEVFNQPISTNTLYVQSYTFKSEENVLSFQFAATNFLNPKKVSYSFFMEGFDKDWRPATKSQHITYTNLPPGNYKFNIRATNDNGSWGAEQKSINITIIPPWYATWWFRLSVILLVIISIGSYVFYKYYTLKRNKAMLEKVVQERTIELREALHISNAQKDSIKFLMRELKHRVKNNLQIISSLLSLQATQMKDNEAVDSLNSAKNRISNISYLENMMDSENEHIQVDVFTKGICKNVIRLISADGSQLFMVEYDLEPAKVANFNITIYGLIINELLTNTSKYAFSGWDEKNILRVQSRVTNRQLELVIEDNGRGYDPDQIKHTSLGLDLVKDMVTQLNGEIRIETVKGTKNIIRIPIEHE